MRNDFIEMKKIEAKIMMHSLDKLEFDQNHDFFDSRDVESMKFFSK